MQKLRTIAKIPTKHSKLHTTSRLFTGLGLAGAACILAFYLASAQSTPTVSQASTARRAHANPTAPAATTPPTSTPATSAQPADDTSPAPTSRVTRPASEPAPVQKTPPAPAPAAYLSQSASSITIGPGLSQSVTFTPSAGSTFFTIGFEANTNIASDVGVLNNVSKPFTVHYSYPSNNPYQQIVPGTYNLTILAQDQHKITHTYHLQVTVQPPTSD